MLICWGWDAVLSHGGTHTGPRLQKASPQTALRCFSAPTEMLWNETSWYNHVTSVAIYEQCWKPDLFPVLCCSSTLLHCYGSSLPILFFTVCNLVSFTQQQHQTMQQTKLHCFSCDCTRSHLCALQQCIKHSMYFSPLKVFGNMGFPRDVKGSQTWGHAHISNKIWILTWVKITNWRFN